MPDQYRSGDKLHNLSAIDSRLAELEREKQQLIALSRALRLGQGVTHPALINLHQKKVREGGLIAGDDYRKGLWCGDGVVRAVDEFIAENLTKKLSVFGGHVRCPAGFVM